MYTIWIAEMAFTKDHSIEWLVESDRIERMVSLWALWSTTKRHQRCLLTR